MLEAKPTPCVKHWPSRDRAENDCLLHILTQLRCMTTYKCLLSYKKVSSNTIINYQWLLMNLMIIFLIHNIIQYSIIYEMSVQDLNSHYSDPANY